MWSRLSEPKVEEVRGAQDEGERGASPRTQTKRSRRYCFSAAASMATQNEKFPRQM